VPIFADDARCWQPSSPAWQWLGSEGRHRLVDRINSSEGGEVAQENVVVVGFTEPSRAYQALSVLKECNADGRIGLDSAAIVERTPEGELRVPEGTDNMELVGTASGSLLGMLIASVEEPAVEVIDGEMEKLDGQVTRRPVADVMDELEMAEEAADAAAHEARRTLREKRKAELHADLDARVGKLKEKLHVS
jgi:hypothetical protein